MKTIIVSLLVVTILIACHRKTTPQISDRTNFPSAPVKPVLTASAEDITAGELVYTGRKCTKCHEAKPVANWTADEWKPILKSMMPRARLDSTERRQVTAYVSLHGKK